MKVFPKDDVVRKILYHPVAGKFRAEGSADWPDDTFTARRLRDGDITKEESSAKVVHGKEHEKEKDHGKEHEAQKEDKEDPEKSSPRRR